MAYRMTSVRSDRLPGAGYLAVTVLCMMIMNTIQTSHAYHVVCYYPSWAQYRAPPASYKADDIDVTLCSHVIFAFAKIDKTISTADWNDEAMYQKIISMKSLNPSLKLLVAVGGNTAKSAPFSYVIETRQRRQDFIQCALTYLRANNLDGLDLDWEFPTLHGSTPEDKPRFTAFVKELYEAFDAESRVTGEARLLLTSAMAALESVIDGGYEVAEVSKYLDFLNLMTYDFHGSWNNYTGHNGGLYARQQDTQYQKTLTADFIVKKYLSLGAPPDKLVVGVPFYGRSWTFCPVEKARGVGAAASCGPGREGAGTKLAGTLAYYEVCQRIQSEGMTTELDPEALTPYAYSSQEWISYDSPQSISQKMEYIRQNKLGGAMVWDLSQDDFNNACGGGRYTLLNSLYSSLQAPEQTTVVSRMRTSDSPVPSSNSQGKTPTGGAKGTTSRDLVTQSGISVTDSQSPVISDGQAVTSAVPVPFYLDPWVILLCVMGVVCVLIVVGVVFIRPACAKCGTKNEEETPQEEKDKTEGKPKENQEKATAKIKEEDETKKAGTKEKSQEQPKEASKQTERGRPREKTKEEYKAKYKTRTGKPDAKRAPKD